MRTQSSQEMEIRVSPFAKLFTHFAFDFSPFAIVICIILNHTSSIVRDYRRVGTPSRITSR